MKHTVVGVISCASFAVLVACKPRTEAIPSSSPNEASVPKAALSSSSEALSNSSADKATDAFAPCLQAAATTKSVDDTEDGLRAVQFLMTCAESYLGSHPNGEHGEDALRLWYKGIVASNEILRSLEEREYAEMQDSAEAQRRLIRRGSMQHLAKDNGYIINRAFQYHTIKTSLILYEQLKSSGIKMESAVPWFNHTNLSRRRTGVWELAMESSFDEGNFVVVREFSRKEPYFSVVGFGVFGPNVTLSHGDQIDAQGWYGPDCRIQVTAGHKTFDYGCDAYLSRQAIDQIVRDMRNAFDDAMVRKEKQRTANTDA